MAASSYTEYIRRQIPWYRPIPSSNFQVRLAVLNLDFDRNRPHGKAALSKRRKKMENTTIAKSHSLKSHIIPLLIACLAVASVCACTSSVRAQTGDSSKEQGAPGEPYS